MLSMSKHTCGRGCVQAMYVEKKRRKKKATYVGICVDICVDMCVGMCAGMCVGMRADKYVNSCKDQKLPMSKHVPLHSQPCF